MIKENQRLLNQINVLSDAAILALALPLAFWLRFFVLPGGIVTVPFEKYLILDAALVAVHLFAFAAAGLYRSFRQIRLWRELRRVWGICIVILVALLGVLFVARGIHYSRWTLALALVLNLGGLSLKRVVLRSLLRYYRSRGYNQKHVIVLGCGRMAREYLNAIQREKAMGFNPVGYVASRKVEFQPKVVYLGEFGELESILEKKRPDEVVAALDAEDYARMPGIIAACEKSGVKLSIVPLYAEYMPSQPQFDEIGGLPLMNIRRIPLDNWGNAFCKRAMDVVGSLILLLLSSPVMLVCAIGVKLSSPGPVFFRQERIGLGKKPFYMYKFRSMRVNSKETTGWSTDHDDRKTRFGAFLRKCSLDEFPQFFNVLKGEMSLVGPRPEVPFYVEQFKEEVPLYMVKHQVRPGITGWAQVNGFRGDTSIKGRIEHDIYYIENWSLWFDIKILFLTLFGGKFMNSEKLD